MAWRLSLGFRSVSAAVMSDTQRVGPRLQAVPLAALAVTAALTLLAWALLALSISAPVPSAWGFRGFAGIFALAFGWIGYLVATRQPHNPIGWCLTRRNFCSMKRLSPGPNFSV